MGRRRVAFGEERRIANWREKRFSNSACERREKSRVLGRMGRPKEHYNTINEKEEKI